jgi:hypothetical protein
VADTALSVLIAVVDSFPCPGFCLLSPAHSCLSLLVTVNGIHSLGWMGDQFSNQLMVASLHSNVSYLIIISTFTSRPKYSPR